MTDKLSTFSNLEKKKKKKWSAADFFFLICLCCVSFLYATALLCWTRLAQVFSEEDISVE